MFIGGNLRRKITVNAMRTCNWAQDTNRRCQCNISILGILSYMWWLYLYQSYLKIPNTFINLCMLLYNPSLSGICSNLNYKYAMADDGPSRRWRHRCIGTGTRSHMTSDVVLSCTSCRQVALEDLKMFPHNVRLRHRILGLFTI